MRCVVVDASGAGWRLGERPTPTPGPQDVLVRVLATGVCYMDVRQAAGEMGDPGRVPGHEFVGEVVSAGDEVTWPAVGERVGVTWHQRWCRKCRDCVRGRLELCRAADETGIYVDGGHAEYALVDAASAVPIPDELSDDTAAVLLCSGYVAYSALADLAVGPGDSLAVVGFGGIGHLAAQYGAGLGAEVTVVTGQTGKVELARELGAAYAVHAPDGDFLGELQDREVTAVLLTSDQPDALQTCLNGLAPYGRISVVSAGVDPTALVPQRLLHYKLGVVGSSQGPRHRLTETFALHGRCGARAQVQTFPLSSATEAISRVEKRTVRCRAVMVP